ncbi:MAG: VCBS repeat-containing protein, partial [Alphaproteobacteria bacterium]|nr:VCBS repeat-containing protein [Alphaproteobacteria bacterium]
VDEGNICDPEDCNGLDDDADGLVDEGFDVDGDGVIRCCDDAADFFLTLDSTTSVRDHVSDGTGGFTTAAEPLMESTLDLSLRAVVDIDHNGSLDVLITDENMDHYVVTCDQGEWVATWTYAFSLPPATWGDLDNDGCVDAAGYDINTSSYASGSGEGVTWLGDCAGGFTEVRNAYSATQILGAWGEPRARNTADLNNDGDDDLYIGEFATGGASTLEAHFYMGNGDGTFGAASRAFTIPNQPQNTAWMVDVDMDGCADWVGGPDADGDGGAVFLAPGNCDGTFDTPYKIADGCATTSGSCTGSGTVSLYDFDGDGDPDLLIGLNMGGTYNASYWENLGGAVFGSPTVVVPSSAMGRSSVLAPLP